MEEAGVVNCSLHFILIPYSAERAAAEQPVASQLITSLQRSSQDLFGKKAIILTYERKTRTFRSLPYLKESRVGRIFGGRVLPDPFLLNHLFLLQQCTVIKRSSDCINFYNPSYFLFESTCHEELSAAGCRYGLALCCRQSSRDLYGIAWDRSGSSRRREALYEALGCLTETVDNPADAKLWDMNVYSIPPSPFDCENSGALSGIEALVARKASDAPIYLNQAVSEALFDDESSTSLDDQLVRLLQRSRTPWVFNTLLNTLEYSAGKSVLTSVPPEVHVSSTGMCNLTCLFCSYTPEIGKPGYLSKADLQTLTVLRCAKTLRLSAGLGEPTLNPHLIEVLEWVAAEHPHIAMNFFTNGVALTSLLQQALIQTKVSWINVSLNAVTAESWRQFCGTDDFAAVVDNLTELKNRKRKCRSVLPLVFCSIVLTRHSIHELPALPELCAKLGIDRFSGFPFFAFGYGGADKYGDKDCFQPDDPCYAELYTKTLQEAKKYGISMELPLPGLCPSDSSIIINRPLHDFGKIEQNEHRLDKLLLELLSTGKKPCFFLWRQASIGSVNRTLGDVAASHYLYPCLGPLSGVDFAKVTPVDFSAPLDFFARWNHPVFVRLRRAQKIQGLCTVCDLCMVSDTRDPELFPLLNERMKRQGMDDLLYERA